MMHTMTRGLWDGTISVSLGQKPDSHPLIKRYRAAYEKHGKKLNPDEQFSKFFRAGFFVAEPFVEALRQIAAETGLQGTLLPLDKVHPPVLENRFILTPREAFYSDTELVPVGGSAGRTCAEIVTVYPPGIPLFVPGEEISQGAIDYINNMAGLGAIIDGLNENNSLVRVVKA